MLELLFDLFLLQQWIYSAAAPNNVSVPLVPRLLGSPQEHDMYFYVKFHDGGADYIVWSGHHLTASAVDCVSSHYS